MCNWFCVLTKLLYIVNYIFYVLKLLTSGSDLMKQTVIWVSDKLKEDKGNMVFLTEEDAKKYDENAFDADAWVCEHCAEHGVNEVFLSKEDADKHDMTCIFNPDNKSYATSKWLGLELYPAYPRYRHNERDDYVNAAVGGYNKAYDVRTGRYLSNKDFYRTCKDWEIRETDSIGQKRNREVSKTKAYDKFVNILKEVVDHDE